MTMILRAAPLIIFPLLLLAGCAAQSQVREIPRASRLAATPEQKALVVRADRMKGEPSARLGGWLDAADAARAELAADPRDRSARADYNFAVARVIDLVGQNQPALSDRPVKVPSATQGTWSVTLDPPRSGRGRLAGLSFTPADRYEFRGPAAKGRVVKQGLGAPVVITGKDVGGLQDGPAAPGSRIRQGLTAVIRFEGRRAVIAFLDPLEQETVRLDGSNHPLAADLTSSIALSLAELEPERRGLFPFFKAREVENNAHLSMLQPYDPGKIPVLLVHGLADSPANWVPLIEYLRRDRTIRRNFQFWFFAYPSGLPYPLSAAELRRQLALIRKRYPGQKDAVVIGHSMGGMISRLLITNSGTKLWDSFFDVSPDDIPLSLRARDLLVGSLIFKPVPKISRVIFASASHRGSNLAVSFWGRIGSALIGNPVAERNVYAEALPYARVSAPARRLARLPNSIDLLAPDNFFVTTVDSLPFEPGVPYHSLIGDRGTGGNLGRSPAPLSTDGVVSYWSSHLPCARSEKVIPSGHWSQLHPEGMAELKRILLRHL
jgi:pimeloyl-ACP methyl ester carboxylesterase